MNCRTQHFAIGMMVLTLGFIEVASVSATKPKSTQDNWESLKQLVTGQEMRAVLNDAKSYSGRFQSVSDHDVYRARWSPVAAGLYLGAPQIQALVRQGGV
ncbi:MAG: hypothetical protein ACLQVM_31130 [Terriglobia bacterium]